MVGEPIYLGVNVDHVATIRESRGTSYPDPVHAAAIAEQAGADGITVHLREDRRHIQERDVDILNQTLQTRLNLEMAATEAMVCIAERIKPKYCCLVPERRKELTTEGGLDVAGQLQRIRAVTTRLSEAGIATSLFIDPDPKQIVAAVAAGAKLIEIHTGNYADAATDADQQNCLQAVAEAVKLGIEHGLQVNAGHGLHYHNVQAIAAIGGITELNIGHSIIACAVISGMHTAVGRMKRLMLAARRP